MNPNPITAEEYNRIPLLEEQPQISPESLRALSNLFIQHEVNDDWGITLLHRHAIISPNHVMVHVQHESTDVCEPRPLQPHLPIAPRSLFLNHHLRFQAYEYDSTDRHLKLSPSFLHDLRDLLARHQLEKLIALEANPEPDFPPMVETMLLDKSGIVCGMQSFPQVSWQNSVTAVPTSWVFRKSLEEEVLVTKTCVTLPTGLHEVRKG